MVLEVLIVLLLIAAVVVTGMSFFVVRRSDSKPRVGEASKLDVDNPQRDIDS
jgi:Na+-transporting methylmalonyl-CoA/oxaloacetate decarboxylase gamma subunit